MYMLILLVGLVVDFRFIVMVLVEQYLEEIYLQEALHSESHYIMEVIMLLALKLNQ